MHRLSRPPKRAVTLSAVLLLVGAGAAVAYLVFSSGAGSGSATLGSAPSGSLVLNVQFANGLTPGNSEPVVVTATNNTSNAAMVDGIQGAGITTSDPQNCPASWFSFTPIPAAQFGPPQQINAGNRNVPLGQGNDDGTLSFTDSGTSQNGCIGQTLTLSVTSN